MPCVIPGGGRHSIQPETFFRKKLVGPYLSYQFPDNSCVKFKPRQFEMAAVPLFTRLGAWTTVAIGGMLPA